MSIIDVVIEKHYTDDEGQDYYWEKPGRFRTQTGEIALLDVFPTLGWSADYIMRLPSGTKVPIRNAIPSGAKGKKPKMRHGGFEIIPDEEASHVESVSHGAEGLQS